jgi:pyruvate formate lyase activating enzyme
VQNVHSLGISFLDHYARCARTSSSTLVYLPDVNDNREAIRAILDFITDFDKISYEMPPYHRLETPKYEYIGNTYQLGEVKLDEGVMAELMAMLNDEYGHLIPVNK